MMRRRVTSYELRVASDVANGHIAPRSPRASRLATRAFPSGISLLEVLISMFVLLFGLMGVAAIFPVGNHYASKSDQYDRGAALSEAAFAELTARGMLRPQVWRYAITPSGSNGEFSEVMTPFNDPQGVFGMPIPGAGDKSDPGPGYAFVLDPMSSSAINPIPNTLELDVFPLYDAAAPQTQRTTMPPEWLSQGAKPGLDGNRWPIRRLTLMGGAGSHMTAAVAETIFRLHDDLTNKLPDEGDRPGIQMWSADNAGTPKDPTDDTLLARQYTGSYSWLATIVPTAARSVVYPGLPGVADLQPASGMAGSAQCEVSVAVFYKREVTPSAESERTITAELNPGNELAIFDKNNNVKVVDDAVADIRTGHWIALAGVHPTTGQFLLKWYRLLSLDLETEANGTVGSVSGNVAVRRAMLEGPDWPGPLTGSTVKDLRAILLPGVIGVSTHAAPMERE